MKMTTIMMMMMAAFIQFVQFIVLCAMRYDWMLSHEITYLASADGLQPGAFFHSLSSMPTYSNEIRKSGITYDDKKNETCWMRLPKNKNEREREKWECFIIIVRLLQFNNK